MDIGDQVPTDGVAMRLATEREIAVLCLMCTVDILSCIYMNTSQISCHINNVIR